MVGTSAKRGTATFMEAIFVLGPVNPPSDVRLEHAVL
ncbi:hypothetical protein FHX06_004015 [Rhizobium sp. BK512]|nr:hypothetical protein [Rhizobium sp. BK512]